MTFMNMPPGEQSSPTDPFSNTIEPARMPDTQKIVEHAVQAERKRAKELEPAELCMTADELRKVLKQERQRASRFVADLARLKSTAVHHQAESEMQEERCINGVMRRLESLQLEKSRTIIELEREEELLTITLQKKLNKIRQEKAELEKVIEREHKEYLELCSKLHQATDLMGESSHPIEVPTAAMSIENNLGALTEMEEDEDEVYDDGDIGLKHPWEE